MVVILQPAPRYWECPNCPVTDVTAGGVGNRFHDCAGLAGLSAPLVPAGSDCRVVAVEREDYIRGQDVRLDGNGRPIAAVRTERPDGSNDCTAFAPTAHMRGDG